jgi:hypothetical protein
VLVRHEQGAAHAAEGYARSSGKVGVLLVTSGPGATNTVTGLTDALMDSNPLVCITGQVPTHLIGSDAFQECDTVGITRHCTTHNYLVRSIEDLPRILHQAFYVASSGRPGPVVIDIPKANGAKLALPPKIGLPDQLILAIQCRSKRYPCVVRWRAADCLGVEFMSSEAVAWAESEQLRRWVSGSAHRLLVHLRDWTRCLVAKGWP